MGPRLAGEAGESQTTPTVAEDLQKRDAASERLRGRAFLAVRLNRLFQADGRRGIARFKRMAARFARLGLDVELQVRYHPRDRDDGDIAKWLRYVRSVVRAFGPYRRVTGLQITNEVNISYSKNTSDGYYNRAVEALVRGVIEAKRTSRRHGYGHQRIGFNYAYRSSGAVLGADADVWRAVGRRGGARLRAATDWVGLDIYPGTFTPGLLLPVPVADHGDALLEGLAQMRECFMPKAGFTRSTPLRIEEIGYPTGPDRSEAAQRRALREFVTTAVAHRGTYGITDFRWFGLRDNNSEGPNFQSYFGLLRDDYSPKPAFAEYRRLIARHGRRSGRPNSRER
ncbi:MAG TPA: hypothetical protein VFQ12_04885 [Thermoleophilaceae bacterium]|nr:hypothetical protein [Thermoleophilaceae bacterium]